MDDFKIFAKLLAAVIACEENGFSMDYFSPAVIGAEEAKRDRFMIKLQKAGYITGIVTTDVLNGTHRPVILWNVCNPEITIQGMAFMRENSAMKSAIAGLKETSISIASTVLQAIISKF